MKEEGLNLLGQEVRRGEKVRGTFFCGTEGRNSLTRAEDSQRKMNLQVRAKLRSF